MTGPRSAWYVLVLMQLLRTSPVVSAPVSVSVSNRIFYDEAAQSSQEAPLTVRVSGVIGSDAAAFSEATCVRISFLVGDTDRREQHDMTRDAAHKAFTFALGATLRSLALSGERHGVYDQVRIEVDGDGNGEFEIEFETAVKVTTSASLGVAKAKKKATFPDALGGVLEVSPSRKLKLELTVEVAQRPSHIAVVFSGSSLKRVLHTTPKKRAESYVVNVDVGKAELPALGEGEFSVTLVVADALYAAPLSLPFCSVVLAPLLWLARYVRSSMRCAWRARSRCLRCS